jgi:hypothetical protein
MRNTDGLRRGGPGRPAGSPNKATARMREVLQGVLAQVFEDPTFQADLVKEIRAFSIDPRVLQMLFNYAFGKAPATLDVNFGQPTLAELIASTSAVGRKVLEQAAAENGRDESTH